VTHAHQAFRGPQAHPFQVMGQSLFSFGRLDSPMVLLAARPPAILAQPALVTVAAQTILDQFFRNTVGTFHGPTLTQPLPVSIPI